MDNSTPGLIIKVIPLKIRLIKGAMSFIPLSALALWCLYDGKYSSFFILSGISAWATWYFYSLSEVRHYEQKEVITYDKKGKKISKLQFTAVGSAAKALDEQIALQENRDWEERVLKIWWVRYLIAAGLCLVAFYINETKPNLWWMSLIMTFVAACYAKELTIAVLGIGLIIWIGSLAFPLSIPSAIIIGAIIIAYTINQKQ